MPDEFIKKNYLFKIIQRLVKGITQITKIETQKRKSVVTIYI